MEDAHLVGYGSSSDEEGKSKKHSSQMMEATKERNFRKHSFTPEKDSNEKSPIKQSETLGSEVSLNNLKESEATHESAVNKSPSVKKQSPTRSKSRSLSPSKSSKYSKKSPQKSPERKQRNRGKRSRSRSRSSSSSTDKESRSAVDEFGRCVRRQSSARSKDEDRGKGNNRDRRRYSKDQRRSRSRSRSKERNRDGGPRRRDHYNKRRDGRDDRYRGRDRGRDRSPDRGRDRSPDRSRDRSPGRGRDRSPDRSRDRSPDRSRDRERRDTRRESDDSWKTKRGQVYLGGTEKKPVIPAKEKAIMSSEEIVKKLAARAESLKHEAQATATNLNLPSYLNPSVVNPQLYAKQQEKRKLLWSAKKTEQAPTNSNLWAGTKFTGDQGGEMQAKFRRLMGIKGEGSTDATEEDVSSKGDKILTDLEKEFERSRAFQLSRGAGGKSGIGLGYAPASYN